MLVLALGVAIGVALSVTGAIDVPADRLAAAADEVFVHSGTKVIAALPMNVQHNQLVPAVIAVVAVAIPGVLSWALACCAGASLVLRRVLAVLALLVGVGGFFVLPVHEAFVLAGGLAVFALFARVATSLVLAIPLVAASVAIGVRQVVRVVNNSAPSLPAACRTLDKLSHVSPSIWHAFAVVVALAPLVAAAFRLLRLPRGLRA